MRTGNRFVLVAVAACAVSMLSAQAPASKSASVHEGFVQLPGAKIFYRDSGGNGIPVVFLHALTGSSEVWENQIPAVTAAGYRFIAYDRRGFGRTVADPAGPASNGPDDLLGLVDYLKIDKFHLVGTAGGGFVALDFALSYPDRLRSFVLANSQGAVTDASFREVLQKLNPTGFGALSPDFRELAPAYRAGNPEGTARWAEFEKRSHPEGPQGPAQPRKNQVTLAMVETIRVPTLIIAGGADAYAPPPVMRTIASRIKNSQFVVVPDTGHSSYWELPDVFNRAVLEFIRKH